MAGGQTRAEQTTGAGAAAGERAAPGRTSCFRVKEDMQTLQKRDMKKKSLQDLLLAEGWPYIALQ